MGLALVRGLTALLAVLALGLPGCTFFARKPALPRHASIEHGAAPTEGADFAAFVTGAEILYFPADRAASGARSEPAALLLDALAQSGKPFAIGWDSVEASQQNLLDELPGKSGGAREELISRLELVGSGRAREHCRAVLRDARLAGTRHLALRLPEVIMAKIDAREKLTPDEAKQLPAGYAPPAGGFEAYTERLPLSGSTSERSLAGSYRAQLASQQFAAERIVRHFRASGTEGKLLIFVRSSDLEAGHGVPHYVSQKVRVRQLVLDSTGSAPVKAKLLTRRDRIGGGFPDP